MKRQNSGSAAHNFRKKLQSWQLTLVVGLLLIFAAQSALGSPRNSAAFDEAYHLATGYVYLRTGDPRLSTEHPPLVNMWNALPLFWLDPALPLDSPAWRTAATDDFGDAFLWQANAAQAVRLVLLGRLPIVALGILLGAVVFRWACDLFGVRAGLLALGLYAFDPNLIAHARLSTTDLGLATWMTISMWRWWAWLQKPSAGNLVLTGLATGAALSTKFSGLALAPLLALTALLHPFYSENNRQGAAKGKSKNLALFAPSRFQFSPLVKIEMRLGALGLLGLLSLLFVWAVYGFEIQSGLPAATYWRGLLKIWAEYSQGYPTFLLGQVSRTAWWYYFPVAFGLKTPLPSQILLAAGLLLVVQGGEWRRAAAVLVPPILLMAAAMSSPFAIGYRHILPVLPFVLILAGRAALLFTFHVPRFTFHVPRFALYTLLLWQIVSAARIYPHHLSYFNELAGNPLNWSKLLVDSNLDWGQDLPALKRLMAERGIEQVYLAYFGTAMPEAYGIAYKPLPGFLRFLAGPEVDAYNPYTLEPGWYAISATSLRLGLIYRRVDLYAYFRDKTPAARAGYSINLYHVEYPPATPLDRRVVTGTAVADLSPDQLGVRPGHRLAIAWASSPQTTIFPIVNGRAPGVPASLIAPWSDSPDFAGAFSLAGYQLDSAQIRPGQALSLTLHWQVSWGQVETPRPAYHPPLAAFVHLVGADPAHIVAQYDGWGTALTGLQAGDRIAQRVTLMPPPDTPAGEYRLLVGLYSPQSMQRLVVRRPGGQADHVLVAHIVIR